MRFKPRRLRLGKVAMHGGWIRIEVIGYPPWQAWESPPGSLRDICIYIVKAMRGRADCECSACHFLFWMLCIINALGILCDGHMYWNALRYIFMGMLCIDWCECLRDIRMGNTLRGFYCETQRGLTSKALHLDIYIGNVLCFIYALWTPCVKADCELCVVYTYCGCHALDRQIVNPAC